MFRGLLGHKYSTGLDTLGQRLEKNGHKVKVLSYNNEDNVYWEIINSNRKQVALIGHSMGGKTATRLAAKLASKGIRVCLLATITGEMDLLEASIRKRLPDLIIADTISLQRQYQCLLWFVEAVQFQEFLRTTLMRQAAKSGVAISAIPITPHSDKDLRIERLQPPMASGLIRLNPTQSTLIDQLQQWPNGDHDDGPDCLDMLWQNALIYSKGAAGGGIKTSGRGHSGGVMEGYRI